MNVILQRRQYISLVVEVGVLVSGMRIELRVWVEDVGTPTNEVVKVEKKKVGEVEGKAVSVGLGVKSVIVGGGGSKNWTSPRKSQVIFGLVS